MNDWHITKHGVDNWLEIRIQNGDSFFPLVANGLAPGIVNLRKDCSLVTKWDAHPNKDVFC